VNEGVGDCQPWKTSSRCAAAKQFRKVNGHLHLGKLRASLQRHVAAQNTTSTCYNKIAA
jgi:hypothetical protein